MSTPEFIAPRDTLLGLLQRGRGEGYRRVLECPKTDAHALLIECITHDPRIDSQVESRDKYYASIAINIELFLEPLAEHLRLNDDQSQSAWVTSLTVDTLTELARRQYKNAADILCDYLQWGQSWEWPLHELLSLPGNELVQRIPSVIERRFPTDETLDWAMCWAAKPFANFPHKSPRITASIARVLAKSVDRAKDDLPDLDSLSPIELLALANQKNSPSLGKAMEKVVCLADVDLLVSHVSLEKPFAGYVALAGLGHLALPSFFEWLTDLWLTFPERSANAAAKYPGLPLLRRGVLQAILALPAETTLPLARAWMTQQNARKQDLAEKLLEEHATAEDIPILRESLRPMLSDEDLEWYCFLIKAFYNLPSIGVVPELTDIFYQFRFSKGREYAAEAIRITSPEYCAKNLAFECLWDCEVGTRELGAKFAPLDSPEGMQRIRHLANDPFESEMVRNEAKGRLGLIV